MSGFLKSAEKELYDAVHRRYEFSAHRDNMDAAISAYREIFDDRLLDKPRTIYQFKSMINIARYFRLSHDTTANAIKLCETARKLGEGIYRQIGLSKEKEMESVFLLLCQLYCRIGKFDK